MGCFDCDRMGTCSEVQLLDALSLFTADDCTYRLRNAYFSLVVLGVLSTYFATVAAVAYFAGDLLLLMESLSAKIFLSERIFYAAS